jgi:hypothetical protein
MRLRAKVVTTTRQWPKTAWASALATGTHLGAVLLKFTTSEDHQAVLRERKGLVGTKLGLDKGLTFAQQVCKSELWSLFKEAKAAGKHAF